MTDYSENELAGLLAKAARGAGVPPGQAAQFGAAAQRHLGAQRGFDDIRQALEAPLGMAVQFPLHLRRAASQGGPYTAHTPCPELFQSYLDALPCRVSILEVTQTVVRFQSDPARPGAAQMLRRAQLGEDDVHYLQALAARTFVPDTAQSRASGAGAGLLDND
jgi:hypothetical protein